MSCLARSLGPIPRSPAYSNSKGLADRQQQALDEAEAAAITVIQDRIYIAFEVRELNLLQRWRGVVLSARKPRVVDDSEYRFNELNADIIVAALNQTDQRRGAYP